MNEIKDQRNTWSAIGLIIVGVLLLLSNYNILPIDTISSLWPLILIFLGLRLLLKK